jgi:tRNA nucleotidyltransferase/poly(A) polymerase|tara:strand:- start:592 stop:1725 length:1134 start_codon:yes stop_codon:yes gene_type:complete
MKISRFNQYISESVIDKKLPVSKEIRELSELFKQNGKRLYIVGGWVRDHLMGRDPDDIDLATDSLPDDTLDFLGDKYSVDLVGKAFGVIILKVGGEDVEIASFREDGDGRKPEVNLGVTIEEDVSRRDLTISALFYDIENDNIVDLVGGINDINNKVIRMVGDPLDRIGEDQLRVLRVARFASRYNFEIDDKTSKAIQKNSDLSEISKERIVEEFLKAFKKNTSFKPFLDIITKLGIWDQIFGDFKINTNVVETNDIILYLSNLLKDNDSEQLEDLTKVFKWPSDIKDSIKFLISLKDFDPELVSKYFKERKRIRIDNETILNFLDLSDIQNKEMVLKFLEYIPSVKAVELIKLGFKGEKLGAEIKRLEIEKFKELL